ncbi:preprotein translocase subunit SecG [Herminiimonas arsenitoxidans]|uniref:preprotein translocase subunit SecG n=1 Tax=Herminiimonas arsenitoxidans TaxID=1809410 RepID=UPI000970E9EA|nr:preprotein translocase subunit SecG [Herminiimonas arsenitoxidans]
MNSLHTIIVVVQVLSALTIIGLVLLQHGKGADMGASFGSGASGSLFGATGSSNFLSKFTGVAAVIFFAATLGLAFIGNKPATPSAGVMENLPVSAVPGAEATAPVAPTAAPVTPVVPSGSEQSNQIPK